MSKLQDEVNPTGTNNTYYSKHDFEMMFYVGIIYLLFYLFK